MDDVQKHFNEIAKNYDKYKDNNKYYYDNLKILLSKIIPKDKVVLEIGCGTGELLAYLKPKRGFGIDISSHMIKLAKYKHKKYNNILFSNKKIKDLKGKKFNYIFMSDVIEHLENPIEIFKETSFIMSKDTKFVITMANPIWEPVLMLAERLNLKMPEGKHHRWKYKEISKGLENSGMVVEDHSYNLLMPINIPIITTILNRLFEPVFKRFCFIEYVVAKKI